MPPQNDGSSVPEPEPVEAAEANNAEKEGDDEEHGESTEQEDGVDSHGAVVYTSHFRNAEAFPLYVRWGVPAFLLATTTLLIVANIGSGVSAEYILIQDGEIVESRQLLHVSVVTSVSELWKNGSYPLAIFIAVMSVSWPFVKLILEAYAWMRPYKLPGRRERFMVILDVLGKWSFVDIMVLVEIMVAFRSTIVLAPTVTLEIVVLPEWGFYAFIIATMASLLSSHIILHFHRQLHYYGKPDSDTEPRGTAAGGWRSTMRQKGGLSLTFMIIAGVSLLISMAFYLTGVLVKSFELTNTRGATSYVYTYSIVSVGQSLPEANVDPSDLGIRFIQVMWFFLGVAMPIWCSFLFLVLYFAPLSTGWMEKLFVMADIAFAWSCAEVLLVSTIFAVLQMPTFGDGLIGANCSACYVVSSRFLSDFAYLCVGAVLIVVVNVFLYRKAHVTLYKE